MKLSWDVHTFADKLTTLFLFNLTETNVSIRVFFLKLIVQVILYGFGYKNLSHAWPAHNNLSF